MSGNRNYGQTYNTLIKSWLKKYGYLPTVPMNELSQMDSRSNYLAAAIKKFQNFYALPETGIIGDIEWTAIMAPRCAHPDLYDPEHELEGKAKSNFLRTILYSGSGSWPMPCQKNGVTFSVNKGNMPSSLNNRIESIVDRVVRAYSDVGLRLLRDDSVDRANIRVSWRRLTGNTIGLAEFNSQSCSDSVFCYLDPGYDPNDDQVCRLLCHEMGHNDNLSHTRGGIMNPSILSGPFNGWESNDPSMSTIRRYHDGTPLDPTPEPEPEPNPDPGPLPLPPLPEPDDSDLKRQIRIILDRKATETYQEIAKLL